MKMAIVVSELTARTKSTPTLRSTRATFFANGMTAVATKRLATINTGTMVKAIRSAP